MARQDSKPTYVNQKHKSSHDLSHNLDFTSSTGQILPVFHQFMNAGEKFKGRVKMTTRTRPLITQPFADLIEQVDWFFVPINLLYSPFDNVRYQNNDWFSSALDVSANDRFPTITIQAAAPIVSGSSSCIYNDTLLDNIWAGTHRLLSHLGMNPNVVWQLGNGSGSYPYSTYQPAVFPYKALAYQCIYQYYYRSDEYELFDRNSFNMDSFSDGTDTAGIVDIATYTSAYTSGGGDFFKLRYIRRGSDYFNNIHISPILQGVNSLDGYSDNGLKGADLLTKINGFLTLDNFYPSNGTYNGTNTITIGSAPITTTALQYGTSSTSTNKNAIQSASIRALFAVEKVLSVTSRTRQTVDDQILAHFGFRVPKDVKHNIQYLGSDIGGVNFGEVVSTAATDGGELGEIAGKGTMSEFGKYHSFTAPIDGVLMAVCYARPTIAFTTNFDKDNAVAQRLDLFVPEFDNLGMQPLYFYESGDTSVSSSNANNIVGWQWRYEQFKRKFNKAITGMATPYKGTENPLNAWTLSRYPYYQQSVTNGARFTNFFVSPTDLNNIMSVQYLTSLPSLYNNNPNIIYQRDPLINHFEFDCHLLSIMSDFSMPVLNSVG